MNSIDVIELTGDPFKRGLEYGNQCKDRINRFIDDDLCRINSLLPQRKRLADFMPHIKAHGEVIEDQVPDLYREIQGLAVGAEITLDLALFLQLRREMVGYRAVEPNGDCTTVCIGESAEGPLLGQTIDLNGNLEDQILLLRTSSPDKQRSAFILTFTGLLGYLGINDRGLCVGLNLVLGGEWRPGIPPYLAIRHLIDNCNCVNEAVAELKKLKLSSSRSITLCDLSSHKTLEFYEDRMSIISGRYLIHTNHYLAPEFEKFDKLNPFAKNSSVKRFNTADQVVSKGRKAMTSDDLMRVFCQKPICVPANGDIRQERTVGAVVMVPNQGEIHIRTGNPSHAITQKFKFDFGGPNNVETR